MVKQFFAEQAKYEFRFNKEIKIQVSHTFLLLIPNDFVGNTD